MAWHPLGWTPAFFSEIDPSARAVLTHRWPGVNLHGDFTTIEAGQYAGIDVLVGGTPCQSFSVAGLRGGMADARGNLALEYLRLADRLRPRWVVWENVPGVLSSADGRDFGSFIGGLAELGYGWAYRILDAQYFGLAQRRKRVFVVGYLGDWRRAAAVLFNPASLRGDPPPSRATRERVAPTIAARVRGGGGLGTDFDCDGGLIADTVRSHPRPGSNSVGNLALALNARGGSGRMGGEIERFVTHSLRADGFDASEDGTGRGTPLVAAINWQSGGDCRGLDPQPTTSALTRQQTPAITGSAVRRLTPLECLRLQGFPDDYFDGVRFRGKPLADGPRYRLLGNSMAVPCMAWIGRRIKALGT